METTRSKAHSKGNIILLSQGRIDCDNVYSINDGILRMVLSKQVYETVGLVGEPAGFWPGRKKHRWSGWLSL